MIRNPFRKAFSSRSKLKQDDVQFEQEVQRLHQMQAISKRLYKDMRKCSEAEAAQSRASIKIISDLKASPCSKSEPLKSIIDGFSNCSEELQTQYKEHRSRQDATFSDPMKRFHNVYKHVDIHVKQRESRLQDLERQSAKLEKRRSSQSTSPAKIELTQRKLASAKTDFEKVNEKLLDEMPKLYEQKVDCFDPCLTGLMSSQLLYHQNCANILKRSLNKLEAAEDDNKTESSLDEIFSQIKSLSIIGESLPPS